jgi:hypothetical protein
MELDKAHTTTDCKPFPEEKAKPAVHSQLANG